MTASASVAPGDRVVLHSNGEQVPLRVLAPAVLVGAWEVPVLASVDALVDGEGVVEVATASGLASIEAHLVLREGRLALRAGPAQGARVQQRREDVRGPLRLPLRAGAVDAAGEVQMGSAVLTGVTTTVSAGGLSLALDEGCPLPAPGTRLYLELDLGDGDLVPAVVRVVDVTPPVMLRAGFVDIAPRDRERLVHLVFECERRTLAARRGATHEGPTGI